MLCQIMADVYKEIVEIFGNNIFIACDSVVRKFEFFLHFIAFFLVDDMFKNVPKFL